MTGLTTGIIAVSNGGQIQFRSGLGQDPEVEALVLEMHRDAARAAQRLEVIPTKKLIVFILAQERGKVYLLQDARDEETLLAFVATVDIGYDILNQLVSSLAVVDERARLRFISPASAASLGLSPGQGIGKPVVDVIANTRLHEVVRTGKPEFGQLEVDGKTRIVSRRPVFRHGRIVGAIGQLMFKGPEQLYELSREIAHLKSEVHFYRRELSVMRTQAYGLEQIIGASTLIRQLKSDIARIAPLDVPVLLVGESGTGKELVAHAIHKLSGRAARPLVVVNAAALPSTLVESELFGYEPGAFTGAQRKGRKGKFEIADKSTLFLDEIVDVPLDIQAKLLRVLQDGMVERIGSDRPHYSGFRLICASNRDLQQMIKDDKFRLDLYYRVSAVSLHLPPLRDRLEDIPLLVDNFIEAYSRRYQLPSIKRVHPDVYAYLQQKTWPGNVRQLLHEVERAVIFCDRDELRVADFEDRATVAATPADVASLKFPGTMSAARETTELRLIKEALARHNGNKSRVAHELGISRSYLYKKLTVLGNPGYERSTDTTGQRG